MGTCEKISGTERNLDVEEAKDSTVANLETTMRISTNSGEQTTMADLELMIKDLQTTVAKLGAVVDEQRDLLRESDTRLGHCETTLGAYQQPEDMTGILDSIAEAREFSMDLISTATAEGLEKVTKWISEQKILLQSMSSGENNDGTVRNARATKDSAAPTRSVSFSLDNQNTEGNRDRSNDDDRRNSEETEGKRDRSNGIDRMNSSLASLTTCEAGATKKRTNSNPKKRKSELEEAIESVRKSDLLRDAEIGNPHPMLSGDDSRIDLFEESIISATHLANTLRSYEWAKSHGNVPTYPGDCYSFLAIYSPFTHPFFFCFGLHVFIFQMVFLMFMIQSKYQEESDNPAAAIFPANVSTLVRGTQILSILCYLVFADSTMTDLAKAIEYFPRFDRDKGDEKLSLVVLSCVLRFIQGLFATFVALLLILTSDDVVDIVLNFTAVNFISSLDDCAFELAKWGKWGAALKKEAQSIEQRPLPYCLYQRRVHYRYFLTLIPIGVIMMTTTGVVIYQQEFSKFWTTQILRVQFKEDTGLQLYSGCYELDPNMNRGKWHVYNSYHENKEMATFGYCAERNFWVLYKNDADCEDHCAVVDKNSDCYLAHSLKTDKIDIYASFEDVWFSASGTPLEMYFFTTERGNGEYLRKNCGSFLGNGECDAAFNSLGNQYDGGDCCAATCRHSSCSQGSAAGAFGYDEAIGKGFRDCRDPNMYPITIFLNNMTSSRDRDVYYDVDQFMVEEYYREKELGFWDEDPATPFVNVDCNGITSLALYINKKMEKHAETIFVPDGATCNLTITNFTAPTSKWDNDPIWWVNYTVYHGEENDFSSEIASGYSGDQETISFQRIPECYFDKLSDSIDKSTVYSANTDSALAAMWIVRDKSRYSDCSKRFLIERFALSAINFAAPIKTNHTSYSGNRFNDDALWISKDKRCRWPHITCNQGSVEGLAVRDMNLDGTISTSVGFLTALKQIKYDYNGLSGTIPTEFGLLTKLTGLDIDKNKLTGTIPTEFGLLTNMIELDLDVNELSGTIPTEMGLMKNARDFDLRDNKLTGTIPDQIYELTNMVMLRLDPNMLSGTISNAIAKMNSLVHLRLGT
jgi:hypothetical protein